GVFQPLLEVSGEQRANVWKHVSDVLPICSDQASERNIVIPDLNLPPLAKQPFYELYLRALPQIVSCRLKAQAKHSDFLLASVENHFDCALQMQFIAGQDRFEQRQFEIEFFGAIIHGANIFGQARTSKREARLQVSGGNIQ